MARPAKPVNVQSKHLTKEELAARQEIENRIRGSTDQLIPPDYLTPNQVSIFKFVLQELEASGILGNLDVYVLTLFAIAADRISQIESEINQDPRLRENSRLMSTREKYSKEFYRGCEALGLSPQSRAKISAAGLKARQEEADPLVAALNGGGADGKPGGSL